MTNSKSELRFRLVRHYFPMVSISLVFGLALRFFFISSDDPVFVFSIISGYIALALSSISLIIIFSELTGTVLFFQLSGIAGYLKVKI